MKKFLSVGLKSQWKTIVVIFVLLIIQAFFQMNQKLGGDMVLIPCLAVNFPFHKIPLVYVILAEAVHHNVDMNVAGLVVPIGMGADNHLVAGEVFFGIFHPKCLSLFSRQPTLCHILRIEGNNIMVLFDFLTGVVLVEFAVEVSAFIVKGIWLTVDTIKEVFLTQNRHAVIIHDLFLGELVVLEQKVMYGSSVIPGFHCDVLDDCHNDFSKCFVVRNG